jgi:RNA polymerase sigma-70 factor (ECF subfamily)
MDTGDFTARTAPFRRELLAHCYRMLGSVHDAEDLVQETYLRAWRAYAGFEGRSSVRTWLYQIATNTCLTALQHRTRRTLPSGLGAPAAGPDDPIGLAEPDVLWLEPLPDALLDPAVVVTARHTLRLALIASMQYLPPAQRAVLVLRDVLAFPAAEVARMLDTTVPAVKSLLQRARARLAEVEPVDDDVVEPTEPAARALLDLYVTAFERSDPGAIERLLRQDASLEMTPATTWFSGRATCLPYLVRYALDEPGDWSMVATTANGQPAVVAYHRRGDEYVAFGVAVLTLTTTGCKRIVVFGDPELAGLFGCQPKRPLT